MMLWYTSKLTFACNICAMIPLSVIWVGLKLTSSRPAHAFVTITLLLQDMQLVDLRPQEVRHCLISGLLAWYQQAEIRVKAGSYVLCTPLGQMGSHMYTRSYAQHCLVWYGVCLQCARLLSGIACPLFCVHAMTCLRAKLPSVASAESLQQELLVHGKCPSKVPPVL